MAGMPLPPAPLPSWGCIPPAPPLPQWTWADEERLRELQSQIAQLMLRRGWAEEKLKAAMNKAGVHFDLGTAINNAEALRDALRPFDSMTRPDEQTGN